ncbi:DUF1254 domain-containing protein [Oceanispirochaeta sp. M2]|nr:DUF1254 domain-containing protein [Oceanispirochaeta sp. M2]NPD75372.1 DUF1254 domain-containing protein [Oceanispirochaeta sp. M1]RDG28783.1 DUF1254 domain-containing protein [Oceanispirochaeta sp. M1]
MNITQVLITAILLLILCGCETGKKPVAGIQIAPSEARAIAREAYIYGNPMVDNYRIQYASFVDSKDPEFKAPWNQIKNISRVFTPDDTAIQTPNSDTPYSWLGLDLRAEPIVLTLPPIEKSRYFSIQLIDMYTHNFDYLGSRTTGNDAGSYLIAGPSWKGNKPEGIDKVVRSETELVVAFYRTQLFLPEDMGNVKKIQEDYKVQTLSAFLDQPASKEVPDIQFIKPLTRDEIKTSPKVFEQLNFVLQFCPTHPSEEDLMMRFAKIGIGAGKTFDMNSFSPEVQAAIEQGIIDAWEDDFAGLMEKSIAGELTSAETFGTREHLQNNYAYRMGAAVLGIWGNTAEEAIYPSYYVDSDGQDLNGTNSYTITFEKDQLPPVNAFWSLTMYELPASLLVANPINRYLLNSIMVPDFVPNEDGSITLYLQHESPGKSKETNWLPAPEGPFSVIMRLYWPKPEALEGTWKEPKLQKIK